MPPALEALRDHYRHRDRAARAWKRAGGRVVGYLCDNVPEELVLAAGAYPYRLSARPGVGTRAIEQYVQVFAAPFSARNRGVGFSDATLNMLLEGEYDFVDLLVVPHTRKTIQALYRDLQLAGAANAELRLPELYFLDRAYSPFYTSEVFNRARVLDLKSALEKWSGRSIADSALSEAIHLTNVRRGLLQQLARVRADNPPAISGVDALQVLGAAAFLHPREFNPLLQQLLDGIGPDTGCTASPRLFLGGSPMDHLQFYALIEACGATIVAEDHCWGNRSAEEPIDEHMLPLEAIADRYHRRPACSIEFPIQKVVARCTGRATSARVDGAIFTVFEGDGVHVWDTPDEIEALRERGIASLYLKQQPYSIVDPTPLRATIGEFLASLGSAPASGGDR
jgi:benzoyl-CoA reductase/2-hydroxyglutaryl-CoA dehydratase subunit BcrC/BadD/HgdB